MHYEHMVLSALQEASVTSTTGATRCRPRVSAVTDDDAALALLGVGDFADFKDLFAGQARELQRCFIDPLDQLDGQVQQAERRLTKLRQRRSSVPPPPIRR